jgi:CRP/FNR family transcriptional regulator, anaerobic regulatory protein
MTDESHQPAPDPAADFSLLRRTCGPCTLKEFCDRAEVVYEQVRRRGLFGRREPLTRGARLFRPGDAQSQVYVVRSGALKTVAPGIDGEDNLLGFHVPGELVGLDALATGNHQCEAIALVDSQVCGIPYTELTSLTADQPAVSRRLLRVFGRGSQDSQDHVQLLMRRQADERIALFLLSMLQRYQKGGHGQAGEVLSRVTLPMSREDMARYLGLALETVSRGLTRLQERGVIRVSGRQISVLDSAALEKLATHEDPPTCGGEARQG